MERTEIQALYEEVCCREKEHGIKYIEISVQALREVLEAALRPHD